MVRGRVTDQGNKPVAGVHVSHDWDIYSWSSSTVTDRDGNYRLEGLVPAESSLRFVREGYRQNIERVAIRAGTSTICDSILKSQATLTGQLVDRLGGALPLWNVYPARDGDSAGFTSKTDGHFELPLREGDDEDIELAAYPPMNTITQRFDRAPRLLERVDPQQAIAQYRPTLSSSPTASFEITLLLPEDVKPDTGFISIACDDPAYHRIFALKTSPRFESIGYSPGKYTLTFLSDVLPDQSLGTFELRAGTRQNLGSIQIHRAVEVELKVNCSDSDRLRTARVIFQDESGKRFYAGIQNNQIMVEPLLAGVYSLSLFGSGIVQERRNLRLEGPPVHEEINLTLGLAATLRLHLAEGEDKPARALVRITNVDSKSVTDFDDNWGQFAFGYRCGLLPGTYTVDVSTSNGHRTTATWFVDPNTDPRLDLELPAR